jgi:hypothetical protein
MIENKYLGPLNEKQTGMQLTLSELQKPENRAWLVLGSVTLLMSLLALVAQGTGDDGDSVTHYLYSRYAFAHPANFFNHWAKPLFVMVSAPFAQWGITGVKLLNVAFWGLQGYFTIQIARHFNYRQEWLLGIFAILAPMNVTHTLSGLTEPMFATWFAWAVWTMLRQQTAAAYLLFSFLPFVRSEGLILLCPLVLYALWRRHYAYLPLLAVGHLVMGLVGKSFYSGDFWWIFNKMTYRGLESAYGHGKWDHFLNNLPSVLGIALCIMLILGLVYGLFALLANGRWAREALVRDEVWLVYAMLLSYFIAHSIFWWKGMFNSFGLMRVMLGIMPAFLLVSLRGWNMLEGAVASLSAKAARPLLALFVAMLLWSFFGRLRWAQDFGPTSWQRSFDSMALKVKEKYPDLQKNIYYLEANAAALPLELDIMDRYRTREAWRLYSGEPAPANSLVVYDDWFFGHEGKVPLDQLRQDKRLEFLGEFEGHTPGLGPAKTFLFVVKPDSVQRAWSYEVPIDTLSSKAELIGGRKAIKVFKKNEFSPAARFSMGSFPPGAKIVYTLDLYCEKADTDVPGLFVFSAEAEYQAYDWRGRPLSERGLKAGQWQTLRVEETLPPGQENRDMFGACLWNTLETPVYISRFTVEVAP